MKLVDAPKGNIDKPSGNYCPRTRRVIISHHRDASDIPGIGCAPFGR